jgi:hypothetical protein
LRTRRKCSRQRMSAIRRTWRTAGRPQEVGAGMVSAAAAAESGAVLVESAGVEAGMAAGTGAAGEGSEGSEEGAVERAAAEAKGARTNTRVRTGWNSHPPPGHHLWPSTLKNHHRATRLPARSDRGRPRWTRQANETRSPANREPEVRVPGKRRRRWTVPSPRRTCLLRCRRGPPASTLCCTSPSCPRRRPM